MKVANDIRRKFQMDWVCYVFERFVQPIGKYRSEISTTATRAQNRLLNSEVVHDRPVR